MRGLGQVTRILSLTGQVKTLTGKQVEWGPKILNIPKILGVVVVATINGEALVEFSIFVNITTIV